MRSDPADLQRVWGTARDRAVTDVEKVARRAGVAVALGALLLPVGCGSGDSNIERGQTPSDKPTLVIETCNGTPVRRPPFPSGTSEAATPEAAVRSYILDRASVSTLSRSVKRAHLLLRNSSGEAMAVVDVRKDDRGWLVSLVLECGNSADLHFAT
ncbi:hypothetical protein GCM10027600_36790 [Nocardioides ginsengisegetis]